MVKFDPDGLSFACVVMVCVSLWHSGRHGVHRAQVQVFVSAIRRQFNCSCRACVSLRSPGCRYWD